MRIAAVPIVAILAPTSAAQDPTPAPLFSNALYATGGSGTFAVADLDGDGRVDVVGTSQTGAVQVLLSDGRGGLRSPLSYRALAGAWGLAVGDFDEDGVPDLAIACRDAGAVAFLRGEGGGVFAPPRAAVPLEDPSKIAAGDFDGDGHLDVAVTSPATRAVWVCFGDGRGGFAPPVRHDVPMNPIEIVAADFDGDGALDLAAGSAGEYSSGLAVLLNHGDGGFGRPQVYGQSEGVGWLRVGDLNADGKLDLVYVIPGSPYAGARVLHGDGLGGFSHPTGAGYAAYPLAVDVADLNRDGFDDLVLTSAYPFRVEVEYGHATGTLTPGPRLGLETWSADVRIADFDQDGIPDIGVAQGDSWVILRRDAAGSFSAPTFVPSALPHGGGQIATADLNGDGIPDVAMAGIAGVETFFGNGVGSFWEPTFRTSFRSDRSLALADLDQDGVLDAVTGFENGGIATLRGLGDGTFAPPVGYPAGASQGRRISIVDLDGDGWLDVVSTEPERSRVVVHLGIGGGSLDDGRAYPTGVEPRAFAVGDFDGDGIPDIVTADGKRGTSSVLLGDGRGGFSAPHRTGLPYLASELAFADVNGDGRSDFVVLGQLETSIWLVIAVYLRETSGELRHAADSPIRATGPMSFADMDRDGAVDVVLPDAHGSAWVLLGDGRGGFSKPEGYLVGEKASGICFETASWAAVCDLDRDRLPEIVTSGICDAIAVLHNERPRVPGSAICAGDGAAGSCPCANTGATGHGCENSANTGGAVLSSSGMASLEGDTLVLTSSGEPADATTIFFQGSAYAAQAPLGQGLVCVGGRVLRLFAASARNGVAATPPGGTSIASRSRSLGDPLRPTSIRVYQALYRSDSFGACRSTFNLSSAQQIVWTQ